MTCSEEIGALLCAAAAALSSFHRIPLYVRDELRQEAVTRCIEARDVNDPMAFVHRVARNLAIDWVRRQHEARYNEQVIPDARWQHQVERQIDLVKLQQALTNAPHAYRALVEDLLFHGVDLDELVDRELRARGQSRSDTDAVACARDALYKRRNRAISFLRRQLSGG